METSFLQGHFLEELSTMALADGRGAAQARGSICWDTDVFLGLRASVSSSLGTQAWESQTQLQLLANICQLVRP